MEALKKKDFRIRESGLRQTVMKAASALSLMVASLLLFLVMPFFPREVMVLVAISLGVLAFKLPSLALVLMVVLALPGYLYQLGAALPAGATIPISVLMIMSVLMLAMAAFAGQIGGILGITMGAIAMVLMLTPFYFLALPLIMSTVLFRTKYLQIRVATVILTFVVLYYPVLAISAMTVPGGTVPILERVSFHVIQPVSMLSFGEVSSKIGQVFNTSSSGVAMTYSQSLTQYWPLSLDQRLLPIGVLFGILAAAAISATAAMLLLFRWLNKREVGTARLAYVAPTLSLLFGIGAFIALSSILERPLNYESTINPFYMLGGGVLIGGCGSVAEILLKKRDIILDFRERLADHAIAVQTEVDFVTNRTEKTKAQCQQIDTNSEDALCRMCKQELTFTEQAVADMSLTDLEQKVALFEELQSKLHEVALESNAKLCQYHDEDWQRYNNFLMLAEDYGFSPGEYFQSPNFAHLMSMEYDEVLNLQANLNQHYQKAARSLAQNIEELEERLCSEVDPDFKRSGIDIARDYFARELYAEALQEFILEAGDIEHVLSRTVAGLDKEIRSVSSSLRTIIVDVLIPTAANLGDAISVNYYHEVIGTIDSLSSPASDKARLPDLMQTVTNIGCIGELIASLSSRLGEKISSLEKNIQDKIPRGYNWGVDLEILKRVVQISQAIRKPPSLMGIHDRMSLIKEGPTIVGSAAGIVKEYSITHELLINYANIEYILNEKLGNEGIVTVADLPLNRKYAFEYLELYHLKHPAEVCFEKDLGKLERLDFTPVA